MKIQLSRKLAACAVAILAGVGFLTAIRAADNTAKIDGKNIRIEFDGRMHSRVIARFEGKEVVLGPWRASETATIDNTAVSKTSL